MENILDLPEELWINITEYLDFNTIIKLSNVSRKLYNIIHSINYITHNKYNKHIDLRNNKYLVFDSNNNKQFINGIKLIKNYWQNIPIHMIFREYHINVLNLSNIFVNYLHNIPNINKISITLIQQVHNNLDMYNLYNYINDIPKTIKSIYYYYNNNIEIPINNEPTYIFNNNIRELTLDLKNTLNLNIFNINYKKIQKLELNNILFNNNILTDELKHNLSNIKELLIHNNITNYDISFLKNNENITLTHTYINQEIINNISKCKSVYIDFVRFIYESKQEELFQLDFKPLNNVNKLVIIMDNIHKIIDLSLLNNVKYLNLYNCNNIGFSIPYFMYCKILILTNTNINNQELKYLKNIERLSITKCKNIDNLECLKGGSMKILNISDNKKIKYIDFLTFLDILFIFNCCQQLEIRNHLYKLKMNNTKLIKTYNEYIEYIPLLSF